MRPVVRIAMVGFWWTMLWAPATGQTYSSSATGLLTLTVPSSLKLSLTVGAISFDDANPDQVPSIAANVPVGITAKARSTPGAVIVLSLIANDDLRSSAATIQVGALTWTAAGTGFVGGSVSRTAAQRVGLWTTAGSWTGTQYFVFANSWDYAAGTYSATLTYTLSAP